MPVEGQLDDLSDHSENNLAHQMSILEKAYEEDASEYSEEPYMEEESIIEKYEFYDFPLNDQTPQSTAE